MLKDHFFSIAAMVHREGNITADLLLDKESEIFKGHFPGQPVVPGACMLQMVKEVLSETLFPGIRLIKAASLKFIMLTDPAIHPALQLKISYYNAADQHGISVSAQLSTAESVCFKFKGVFVDV